MKNTLAAIVGTSAMTKFSYVMSDAKQQQFREPELLNDLINSCLPSANNGKLYGWLIHYGVGLSFVTVYNQLWKRDKLAGLIGTSLLGVISGLIGVGAWKIVFKWHPSPPKDQKSFFRQLIIAHIIFSASARLSMIDLSKKEI